MRNKFSKPSGSSTKKIETSEKNENKFALLRRKLAELQAKRENSGLICYVCRNIPDKAYFDGQGFICPSCHSTYFLNDQHLIVNQ